MRARLDIYKYLYEGCFLLRHSSLPPQLTQRISYRLIPHSIPYSIIIPEPSADTLSDDIPASQNSHCHIVISIQKYRLAPHTITEPERCRGRPTNDKYLGKIHTIFMFICFLYQCQDISLISGVSSRQTENRLEDKQGSQTNLN